MDISPAADDKIPNLDQLVGIVRSQPPEKRTETVNALMTGPATTPAILHRRALFITELRERGVWPT